MSEKSVILHPKPMFPKPTFRKLKKIQTMRFFYEIKRKKDDISIGVLKQKEEVFLQATHQFKEYKIAFKGLSREEI